MQHGKEFIKLESREMSLILFWIVNLQKVAWPSLVIWGIAYLVYKKIGNVTNHHTLIIHFLSEKALKSWIALFELPYVLTTVFNDHEIYIYIRTFQGM